MPRITLALGLLACSLTAWAEPYIAIEQGLQCSACHTNPSGGGQRTAYGNIYAQTQMPATGNAAGRNVWNGRLGEWFSVGANARYSATQTDIDGLDTNLNFATERASLYLAAEVNDRLTLYIDQQVAPNGSLNREAWAKFQFGSYYLKVGKMWMPFGWRLEDDESFVRQLSGINMTQGDDGVELGWESSGYTAQISVTNGNGGRAERDDGKQISVRLSKTFNAMTLGISALTNNTDNVDRQALGLFAGLRTGPVSWLFEYDMLNDDLPSGIDVDTDASLFEANWLISKGHNLKFTAEYLFNIDMGDETDERYSVVYETTPWPFTQIRAGYRQRDSDNPDPLRNYGEGFVQIHGFF